MGQTIFILWIYFIREGGGIVDLKKLIVENVPQTTIQPFCACGCKGSAGMGSGGMLS